MTLIKPPTKSQTYKLVHRIDDKALFHIIPYNSHWEYQQPLIAIVEEQYYLPVFISLDTILDGAVRAEKHLLHMCQEVYPERIHQLWPNQEDMFREQYHVTMAKFLYATYHLEYVLGVQGFHRFAESFLANFTRHGKVIGIDPMLAHILVRMMCSVYATYSQDYAHKRVRECLYQAAQAWYKYQEERELYLKYLDEGFPNEIYHGPARLLDYDPETGEEFDGD